MLVVLLIGACGLVAVPDEVVLPDPNLRRAIREAVGIGKGTLQTEDLESLTMLVASARGISDLAGLDACIALERLYLDGNDIGDVHPLAGLTSLVSLTLNGNRILDVTPLSGLTQLASLALHANDIHDIRPIASLQELETLSIGDAVDNLLPLVQLPRLTRLRLIVRPTADLSPLSLIPGLEWLSIDSGRTLSERPALDPEVLAGCTRLTTLRINGYDVADLQNLAAAVPALRSLELQYVGLEDVPHMAAFPQLSTLALVGVVPSSDALDLSTLVIPSSVTSLTLENNELENAEIISAATQLGQLSLKRNRISSIDPLHALTKLTVLDVSFNPITDLTALRALTSLRSVTIQGVPFERTEGSETNLLMRELLERGVNIYY